MTETATSVTPAAVPAASLPARLIGVIFSPRDTYAAVAAHPRWLGVMAITLGVGAAAQYVLMSSPAMQDAIVEQQIRAGASDQQIAGLEQFLALMPAVYTAAALVIGPLFVALIAGLLLWVFSLLLGGSGTFRQVFAIVTHSGVISMLAGVLSAALILAGVPPSGVQPPGATLDVFVPMLEATHPVTLFLGSVNLVLVWWLVSLAIGLGVLYKRRTGAIAASLLGIYAVIALIIAVVRS